MQRWAVHGDGHTIAPGEVVAPGERLTWPRTTGIAVQHVVAMFGATFLAPLLTGFPPTTTIFFSGVGTLLFWLITRGRVPSYLGSSFAFISPVLAAKADGGMSEALGGIVVAGVTLALVGLAVVRAGAGWIDRLLPPVVTGTIVALIGFNLAPTAKQNAEAGPWLAAITLVATLLFAVLLRGFLGRISVFLGVAVGYAAALVSGQVDLGAVGDAAWFGLPEFTTPTFAADSVVLFLPVVLVLIAENVGHVKAVAAMTGHSLDDSIGRALLGDGVSTALSGLGGGLGTTTYAENIGVMAATRVYSTAAYVMAGGAAVALSLSPKVGALVASIPSGVLGGVTIVLYGMIGVLGARIWINARVDFSDPVNLMSAAVGLVIGIADIGITVGDFQFTGIAVGTVATLVVYHGMRVVARVRGTAAADTAAAVPAPPD